MIAMPSPKDPIPTHVLALSSRRARTRQGEIGARSKMIMLNTFERRLKHEIEQLTTHASGRLSAPETRGTIPAGERVVYAELSHAIVGAAIEVHRHLGPGQLESVYKRALAQELTLRAIAYRRQVSIPMLYKGCAVGEFFADLIVDDKIVVELKAVAALQPVPGPDAVVRTRDAAAAGLVDQFQRPRSVPWRSPIGSVSLRIARIVSTNQPAHAATQQPL